MANIYSMFYPSSKRCYFSGRWMEKLSPVWFNCNISGWDWVTGASSVDFGKMIVKSVYSSFAILSCIWDDMKGRGE